MKRINYIAALFIFFLVLVLNGQSNHNELNGLYSNGERSIYFKNGDCIFFKHRSETSFQKQEHYAYTYTNKQINFKYTGQFQQKYNGNQVTKIWWRLTDERLRDTGAFIRISSLKDWLNKQYEDWADYYANKLFDQMVKKRPEMSKGQFQECIAHQGYIDYSAIANYAMDEEFSILDIISNIYDDLKKLNLLKGIDAKSTTPEEEVELSTDYNVKWSDWSYIEIEDKSRPNGVFAFNTYIFPGKKLTIKERVLRVDKKPNVEVFLGGELYYKGKIIGRFTKDGTAKNTIPREFSLAPSMWHRAGGTFLHEGKTEAAGLVYYDTKWKDLLDGDYQIKMAINEKGGAKRVKTFSFKITNGTVIGDGTISETNFKKKHGLKRFDGEHIFLSAQ